MAAELARKGSWMSEEETSEEIYAPLRETFFQIGIIYRTYPLVELQ